MADHLLVCDIHENHDSWSVVSRKHGHVAKCKTAAAAHRCARRYFDSEAKTIAHMMRGKAMASVESCIRWHPVSDVGEAVADAIAKSSGWKVS